MQHVFPPQDNSQCLVSSSRYDIALFSKKSTYIRVHSFCGMWRTFSLKVFSLWNSVRVNRVESIINITQLSRNEHGLCFVLLFGNRWCRLVHKIHSAAVAWSQVHYLPSFVSSLPCHVPLYFCFRVLGSPRATVKRNGDIGLSKLNTFY